MDTNRAQGAADVGAWASLLLRLAVASLFLAAAVSKWKGGGSSIRGTVEFFRTTFANSWLPGPLVVAHAYATLFVEPLIVLWLVIGCRLKAAWVLAGVFLVTLAFGMSVAGQHAVAASNFNYVLICCAGLYVSRFDRYSIDAPGKRQA